MDSNVLDTWFRVWVHGTVHGFESTSIWFGEYGVHVFGGTGAQGT